MFRLVERTEKTKTDILAMGGKWGVVSKEEAIKHIENFEYRYYVRANGFEMNVTKIYTPYGFCLSTTPDKTSEHNLYNLPDL